MVVNAAEYRLALTAASYSAVVEDTQQNSFTIHGNAIASFNGHL